MRGLILALISIACYLVVILTFFVVTQQLLLVTQWLLLISWWLLVGVARYWYLLLVSYCSLQLVPTYRVNGNVYMIEYFSKFILRFFLGTQQVLTSIKLLCNFIVITLWHGCSPVNLLHIFRSPFSKKTSGRVLLNYKNFCYIS